MKPTYLKLSLVAALSLSTALPALAQYRAVPDPQADAEYQQRLRNYEGQQQDYQNRRENYEARRDSYNNQRDTWARDANDYARERAQYDARYGPGAWQRNYGSTGYRYSRDDEWRRYYSNNPCERRAGNTTAGGVIGALAGAAIGSSIAGRGDRTEGAVLGGIVGAVAGASIANSTAKCDTRGYYFTYDQTRPYREPAYYNGRASGRRDYRAYSRMRCRLAIAPAYTGSYNEGRYVRVCPDGSGRYRITG